MARTWKQSLPFSTGRVDPTAQLSELITKSLSARSLEGQVIFKLLLI